MMQVMLLTGVCLMWQKLDAGQIWQVKVMLADLLVTSMQSVQVHVSCKYDTTWTKYWAAARNACETAVLPTRDTLKMLMQQTKIQSVLQQDLHNNGSFQNAAYGSSWQKRFRFPNFHMKRLHRGQLGSSLIPVASAKCP